LNQGGETQTIIRRETETGTSGEPSCGGKAPQGDSDGKTETKVPTIWCLKTYGRANSTLRAGENSFTKA